jgi:hypothetical protein
MDAPEMMRETEGEILVREAAAGRTPDSVDLRSIRDDDPLTIVQPAASCTRESIAAPSDAYVAHRPCGDKNVLLVKIAGIKTRRWE